MSRQATPTAQVTSALPSQKELVSALLKAILIRNTTSGAAITTKAQVSQLGRALSPVTQFLVDAGIRIDKAGSQNSEDIRVLNDVIDACLEDPERLQGIINIINNSQNNTIDFGRDLFALLPATDPKQSYTLLLLMAAVDPNLFRVLVKGSALGSGSADYAIWQTAENLMGPRPAARPAAGTASAVSPILQRPSIALPKETGECLTLAQRINEGIKAHYHANLIDQGAPPSGEIDKLIRENETRIAEINRLTNQAQDLMDYQLAAIAAGEKLIPDFLSKIERLNVQIRSLTEKVIHSRDKYLRTEATLEVELIEKQQEQVREAAKWGDGFDLVIEKSAKQRKLTKDSFASSDQLHGVERMKRYLLDDLFGDSAASLARREARLRWVKEYTRASSWSKPGMVIVASLKAFLGFFVAAFQYWSYGINKVAGAWVRSLKGAKENRSSWAKFAIRTLALLFAIGVTVAICLIPGVNLMAAALVGVFVITPLVTSALVYLTRGLQDYFERPKLNDNYPYKVNVDLAELSDNPDDAGNLTEITLDKDKLNVLLAVVSKVERALLDESRALSESERNQLNDFKKGIVKGDIEKIKSLLSYLNALDSNRQVTVKDLESVGSKNVREEKARTASSTASNLPAQPNNLSEKVLGILRAPVPATTAATMPPAPLTAASALPTPTTQTGGAAQFSPVYPIGATPPPPPPLSSRHSGGRVGVTGGGASPRAHTPPPPERGGAGAAASGWAILSPGGGVPARTTPPPPPSLPIGEAGGGRSDATNGSSAPRRAVPPPPPSSPPPTAGEGYSSNGFGRGARATSGSSPATSRSPGRNGSE